MEERFLLVYLRFYLTFC